MTIVKTAEQVEQLRQLVLNPIVDEDIIGRDGYILASTILLMCEWLQGESEAVTQVEAFKNAINNKVVQVSALLKTMGEKGG